MAVGTGIEQPARPFQRPVDADAAAQPATPAAQLAATDPVAQAAGAQAPETAVETPAPAVTPEPGKAETGLTRGGFINGVPQEVVAQSFDIDEPGETAVVDAENRVFLVTLDAIHPAASDGEEAQQVREGIDARLADSLRQDVFEYFTRALQAQGGVTLNQTAIDAVNAQLQ